MKIGFPPHPAPLHDKPPLALAAALKAEPGSTVCLIPSANRGGQELTLRCHRGGMTVDATLPTEDVTDFPQRPEVQGSACFLPAATLRAIRQVATCASTDRTRYVLNSVCLRPEDGGVVVATDGRKLAVVPAQVPGREFILPKDVVHVLGHPDFLIERPGSGDGGIPGATTATWDEDPRRLRLAFECGRHLLLARAIEGNYPDNRRAVPATPTSEALLPPSHLSGVITWLKSLRGRGRSVDLSWKQPGQLLLTYRDTDGNCSTMTAPVRVKSNPPAIAFAPEHLAVALEIGPTLCLLDKMTRAIAWSASGGFCVVMPMRVTPLPGPRHADAGEFLRLERLMTSPNERAPPARRRVGLMVIFRYHQRPDQDRQNCERNLLCLISCRASNLNLSASIPYPSQATA